MFFNRRQAAPTEKRILLPQVTWPKLETLLEELGPTRAAHLAYDRGRLEMTTPLEAHERCGRLLESLLLVIADETGSPLETLGSLLLLDPDQGRAIQPDRCYSARPILPRGDRAELDLTQQSAPKLAIDISLSNGTLNRFAIYAELGIPEVWEYRTSADDQVFKGQLTFHGWRDDRYLPLTTSDWFPVLDPKRVLEFLEQSDTIGLVQALQVLRVWAKTL